MRALIIIAALLLVMSGQALAIDESNDTQSDESSYADMPDWANPDANPSFSDSDSEEPSFSDTAEPSFGPDGDD